MSKGQEIIAYSEEPTEFTPIKYIFCGVDYGYISRKRMHQLMRMVKADFSAHMQCKLKGDVFSIFEEGEI